MHYHIYSTLDIFVDSAQLDLNILYFRYLSAYIQLVIFFDGRYRTFCMGYNGGIVYKDEVEFTHFFT